MDKALEIVMPCLSAQSVGQLARTCTSMAEAARKVTERRAQDASQGWEAIVIPIENHFDDCRYPDFQYTPYSWLVTSPPWGHRLGRTPWGEDPEAAVAVERRRGMTESEFGGAITTGSVLHHFGIGCRCSNDCSLNNGSFPGRRDQSSVQDLYNEDGIGSISRQRRHLEAEELKGTSPTTIVLKENVGDQVKIEERFEEASLAQKKCGPACKRKRGFFDEEDEAEAVSSCPCGRSVRGGELAYDSSSRLQQLRAQHARNHDVAVMAEHALKAEDGPDCIQDDRDMTDAEGYAGVQEDPPLVMECGEVCSCSSRCGYRVSQNGLAVKVKVARTRFKGWGLWSLQSIMQGSFVCEYAGELMTTQKARERQHEYDRGEQHDGSKKHWQGSALLVVREHLPSGQASVRVNVDATRIGNVARFMNHSCDGGNLMPCLIRTAGCVIPKLALFARRDILSGEELTYSYGGAPPADVDAGVLQRSCFCGSDVCLGWLPSEIT